MRRKELILVVPPVVIVGPATAGALLDALQGQKETNKIYDFIAFMRTTVFLPVRGRELDTGSNNAKYLAYEEQTLPPLAAKSTSIPADSLSGLDNLLTATLFCGIHNNMHAVAAVLIACALQLITAAYSMALLFRMGNYYLRLVLAVRPWVDEHLDMHYHDPNSVDVAILMFLLGFFHPAPAEATSTKQQR